LECSVVGDRTPESLWCINALVNGADSFWCAVQVLTFTGIPLGRFVLSITLALETMCTAGLERDTVYKYMQPAETKIHFRLLTSHMQAALRKKAPKVPMRSMLSDRSSHGPAAQRRH
jgi:hypothetical protein